MFIVRDTFRCKPGRAKELVGKFKAAQPHFAKLGGRDFKIMTDAIADFWTVCLEFEIDTLEEYAQALARRAEIPELGQAMAGYMECVESGRREVFHLE